MSRLVDIEKCIVSSLFVKLYGGQSPLMAPLVHVGRAERLGQWTAPCCVVPAQALSTALSDYQVGCTSVAFVSRPYLLRTAIGPSADPHACGEGILYRAHCLAGL